MVLRRDALVARARVGPTASGPLDGLAFVVKDVIDVRGRPTGMGNPTWRAEAEPAVRSAAVVEELLAAGATCVGSACSDELAYSVSGVNAHEGAPPNPADPERSTGGSSSGSASAVASGIVPFALGTDTAGSIRVPASYCGLVGHRPTHGAVSRLGVGELAPRFDTVGWLAASAEVAERVGEVLLPPAPSVAGVDEILVLAAPDLVDPDVEWSLQGAIAALAEEIEVAVRPAPLGRELLDTAFEAFRVLQGAEAHRTFGPWWAACPGALGPDVAARLEWAATITPAMISRAERDRDVVIAALSAFVGGGSVMVLPATPTPAPTYVELAGEGADDLRRRTLSLTCLASLWGAPALSVPLSVVHGLPVGLSVVGAPGEDRQLLALAGRCARSGLLPSAAERDR